jgi:hypothetical protein
MKQSTALGGPPVCAVALAIQKSCSQPNASRCFSCVALTQDARKGVKFIDLPLVLQLQLKRFAHDSERGVPIKVSVWKGRSCRYR